MILPGLTLLLRLTSLSLVILFTAMPVTAIDLPDRRKDQFPTDSGYYLVPAPYSIPGLGEGFIIIGSMVNINQSYTDVYGFAAGGDIEGYGLFGTELHLVDKKLLLDVMHTNFQNASSQVYSQRGMKTSANDFILAELDHAVFTGARLTYTMFDRRLEFYGVLYKNESRLSAIRDSDGNLIQSTVDSQTSKSETYTYGMRLDLTDDYIDPRRGIRAETSMWHSPPNDDEASDFDIFELNLTGYMPMGSRNTLALNYFQADTLVNRQGQTDPSIVEADLGLDCSTGSEQDQASCQSIVNNTVAENTFGSVGSLGGLSRLRSYPEDRFKGSHAKFIGVEFRWNLVEETKPFNYFFAKDIRTVIQLAAFYERGAISDNKDELWNTMRDSYGIGARLVTKSGLIFRADIATGDEGEEISIIFGFPWESF
jgi:outer membrane protein assembly factor BamA